MINFNQLKQSINGSSVARWYDELVYAVEQRLSQYTHGELASWKELMTSLPNIEVSAVYLNDGISVVSGSTVDRKTLDQLKQLLLNLHPWRKGPFSLFGLDIDTEWRSDWKWDRIAPHIASLENKSVLDVGCGNGYHCFRMSNQNPRFVLGIDPSQKYLAQFTAIKKYLNLPSCHLLPLRIEDMPKDMGKYAFDSVFCMGVLYHQKSPISLIYQLKNLLKQGGELVLETLVVDGDENTILVPRGRYAQMRNVWFLPSVDALKIWLEKCGFHSIKVVDINQTSVDEQRTTEWMTFHSLQDFLDKSDSKLTVEGYPAPKRAVLLAKKY